MHEHHNFLNIRSTNTFSITRLSTDVININHFTPSLSTPKFQNSLPQETVQIASCGPVLQRARSAKNGYGKWRSRRGGSQQEDGKVSMPTLQKRTLPRTVPVIVSDPAHVNSLWERAECEQCSAESFNILTNPRRIF